MKLAAKNLWKPFKKGTINFPIELRAERNRDEVIGHIDRDEFIVLVELEVVVGVGSWKRIKYLQSIREPEIISSLRRRLLNRPPSPTKLHYRDQLGDTHSVIVVKRNVQGSWHKWDNNFSIEELRKHPNAIEAKATKEKREGEKALRYVPCPKLLNPVGRDRRS